MSSWKNKIKLFALLFCFLNLSSPVFSQGNGADFGFQGLSTPSDLGVKAVAMGNAFTAIGGDLNSLFFNAAGLADIQTIQFSFSGMAVNRTYWENSYWIDRKQQPLYPFIFDGRLRIDPSWQGITDEELFDLIDIEDLHIPEMGKYYYDKAVADWVTEQSSTLPFNSIAVALPLKFRGQNMVISGSFHQKFNIYDFDRNDAHTDPFVADYEYMYNEYIVDGDTAAVNLSRFTRKRTGNIRGFKGAIAGDFGKYLNLGIGINFYSGKTNDNLVLDKLATLDMWSRYFIFYADSAEEMTRKTGTSEFSGAYTDINMQLKFERFRFGFVLNAPYTLKRKWSYKIQTENVSDAYTETTTGTDEVRLPATCALGMSARVTNEVNLSFDLVYNPYSKAEFKYSSNGYGDIVPDSTQMKWVDQRIYRVGIAYTPVKMITLMAGYQNMPRTFIPWGAADRSKGPLVESYTCGFSFNVPYGRLDFAYNYQQMKYAETAYTYINYITQKQENFYVGYTLNF